MMLIILAFEVVSAMAMVMSVAMPVMVYPTSVSIQSAARFVELTM
jgi:hypothetical protein